MKKIKLILLCLVMLVASLSLTACGKLDIKDYVDTSRETNYKSFNDITIDGDDSDWENQKKLSINHLIGGTPHDIKVSTYFSDDGLITYFNVTGAPVYYNPGRSEYHNSGIEMYLSLADKTVLLDNAWQIEIFPTGYYNTTKSVKAGVDSTVQYRKYFIRNMEHEGQVFGTINSADSTGYMMETFIPWEALGVEEAPDAVSINFAVLYCTTYEADKRDAWVDVGNEIAGCSYGNPSTWFKFTKEGYYDPSTTTPYTVNGGNELVNGQVSVTGNYNEGGTVTVTPDDGYTLKTLKINGESIDLIKYSYYAKQYYIMDIEAEFKPVSGNVNYFVVKSGFSYGNKYLTPDTSITFIDASGEVYAGKTDEDGKLIVAIPDGDYTIKTGDYKSATVTVSHEQGVEKEIVLERNVIKTGTYGDIVVTEDENGGKIEYKGGVLDRAYNPEIHFNNLVNVDTTVLEFTVIAPETTKNTYVPIKFAQQGTSRNYYYLNLGMVGNGISLMPFNNDGFNAVKVTDKNVDLNNDGTNDAYSVRVVIALTNNDDDTSTFSMFYYNGETLTHIASDNGGHALNAHFISGSGDIKGDFIIKNIKIYDGEEAFSMGFGKIKVNSTGDADVEISADVIVPGASAKVNVTPKDKAEGAYVIKAIKINGVPVSYEYGEGSEKYVNIKHPDFNVAEYVIDVETEAVSTNSVSITLTSDAGEIEAEEAILIGPMSVTTSINNGVITEELSIGEYFVYVDGYAIAEAVIANETTEIELSLIKNPFGLNDYNGIKVYGGDTLDIVYEGEGINRSALPYIQLTPEIPSDNFIIEFTLEIPVASEGTWIPFKVNEAVGSSADKQYYYLNLGVYNGKLHVKPFNEVDAISAISGNVDKDGDTINETISATFAVMVVDNKDNSSTMSMFYHDGESFVFIGSGVGGRALEMGFLSTSGEVKGSFAIRDIKITSGQDAEEFFGNISVSDDAETAKTTVNMLRSTIVPYGYVKVEITPKDLTSYVVDSVKINGDLVDIENFTSSGAAVVYVKHNALTSADYEISAIVKTVTFKDVELTVKKFDGVSVTSPVTEKVNLFGLVSKDFIPDADGKATVELFNGSFTLKLDGYYPATVNVTDSTTTLEVVLAKKIFEDNNNFNVTYDATNGYTITSETKSQTIKLASDYPVSLAEDIKVEFVFSYNKPAGSSPEMFPYLQVFGKNSAGEEVNRRLQFNIWHNSLEFKDVIDIDENNGSVVNLNSYVQPISVRVEIIKDSGEYLFKVYLNNNLVSESKSANKSSGKAITPIVELTSVAVFYNHQNHVSNLSDDLWWKFSNFKVSNI